MSSLRQRFPGNTSSSQPREESPEKAEEVRLAPVSKIITDDDASTFKHYKSRKRRNGVIFFLGGLVGIVAAGLFAKQSDLVNFPELGELSMDSILDVLPAGFVKDANEMVVRGLFLFPFGSGNLGYPEI